MSRVRLGNVLVLAGMIGGSAGWLGWVPYQPERMLHGIPQGAVAVTAHHDLAGRQESLLQHPLAQLLITYLAAPDAETEVGIADPAFQTQLRRFGSSEFVAAYVPAFGPLAMDSFVFSSWLGGRSHWLRWIMLQGNSGMRREQLPGGRVYWITETDLQDEQGRTLRFSITFEEGLALGCLSVDPHNIRMVIGCYDRNLPSVLTQEPRLTEWVMRSPHPDRGWVGMGGMRPFRYMVTDLQADHLSARLRFEGEWATVSSDTPLSLPALFGALPFGSAMASRDLLAEASGSNAWTGDLLTLLDELGAHAVGLSVFGGEYGGRLRGVRTPALVLAIPCADGPAGIAQMYRMIHRLRLREALDLSVVPAPGGEPILYSLGTLGKSFYGNLPAAERGAFCVADGWLLIASNRVSLQRLLERREWAASASGRAGEERDALWASADLVRGEKPFRNALAVYSVVQLLQGGGGETNGAWLDVARALVSKFDVLVNLDVRAHPEQNELVLEVEVGQ